MAKELSAADSETNDVSPAGKIYQAMVKDLLAAEYDRRTKIEGRGSTIVTASASLLTLHRQTSFERRPRSAL